MSTIVGVTAFFILSLSASDVWAGVSYEHTLMNRLRTNYPKHGKDVRPVHYAAKAVPLTIGLSVLSFDFHPVYQRIAVNSWMIMNWEDKYLRWNPKDFGGLESTRVPSSDIWTPDIALYNSNGPFKPNRDALVLVYNNGSVIWVPQTPIAADCEAPNSRSSHQSCHLKFGSWAYNEKQIDLKALSDEVDMGSFQSNRYWDVLSAPVVANSTHYPCCKEAYPTVTFTLNLKRKFA